MEGKNITLGAFVVLFLGVIVALAILPAIADQQSKMTTKINTFNETQSISSARLLNGTINTTIEFNVTNENTKLWKQTNCHITNFVMRNFTNDTLTLDTHYAFSGVIGNYTILAHAVWNNSDFSAPNLTYLDYVWCGDGYITSSGRSIAGMIVLFTALALLGFVIYYSVRDYFK